MSYNNYEIQRDIRDLKLFLNGLSARIDILEQKAAASGAAATPATMKASTNTAVKISAPTTGTPVATLAASGASPVTIAAPTTGTNVTTRSIPVGKHPADVINHIKSARKAKKVKETAEAPVVETE